MTRQAFLLVMVAACGGGSEPAKNAGSDCPAGMVKQGGDCVAPEGQGGPGQATTSTTPASTGTVCCAATPSTNATATSTTSSPSSDKVPYDKDGVETVLRRAAGQVKSSCGNATDENGKANGPWGTTKVAVTLGRRGRVQGVDLPERYKDKPVGVCVQHAFGNLIFPPYAAPADVVVEWEVEIVRPAGI
jgi:hypothetical protein